MNISSLIEKFDKIQLPEDGRIDLIIDTLHVSSEEENGKYGFYYKGSKCSIYHGKLVVGTKEDCRLSEAIDIFLKHLQCDLITKMTVFMKYDNFSYRQVEGNHHTKSMMVIWFLSVLNTFGDRLEEFENRK